MFGSKLLRCFIVIAGILYHVEAKAFQTKEDNSDGTYDHVHKNLHLNRVPDKNGGKSYEMRYIPHVDGKPIFIPFDEFETLTPPSFLKARPNYLKYKPNVKDSKNDQDQNYPSLNVPRKDKDYSETSVKQSLTGEKVKGNIKGPIQAEQYPKEKKEVSVDHPIVINVVNKSKIGEDIAPLTLKHGDKSSNKHPVKQEIHEIKPVKGTIVKETAKENYDSFLKHDQTSKHYLKDHAVDNHVESKKKQVDSPVIVESLTETSDYYDDPVVIRPFSTNHKVKTSEKKVTESNNLAVLKHKEPIKKAYDAPVIVESIGKETELDYHHPIVTRPQSEKHSRSSVGKTDEIKVIKPVVTDNSPNNKLKPALYMDSKTEGGKATKSAVHDSNELFLQDQESDYDQESNEDYDSPVIVEALVRKSDKEKEHYENSLNAAKKPEAINKYDSPVVVEALVKKTEDKDEEYYEKPKIYASLIDKYPVKFAEHQNEQATKNRDYSIAEDTENHKYEAPIVVEALVKKNPIKPNKKRIKYSAKMKPTKISTHSQYEDSLIDKHNSQNVDTFHSVNQNKPNVLGEKSEIITTSPSSEEKNKEENLSNEDFLNVDSFGEANEQFDTGSGINAVDDSRSLGFKSSVWPLLTSFHSQERNKFKKCTTTNNEPGNCMPIQMCPTPNLQLTLDDLLKKVCTIDEVFIGICCPQFPAETLKVDWENVQNVSSNEEEETKLEGCGQIEDFGKDPQSWPWMAPLISVSTRRIFCGGVLIGDQYVLTAAHCTRKIPRNQIVVVLGPSAKDSTSQEFEVVEIKRHAQYNPRTMQNDLALLKLSRKVWRPYICLPDDTETFVGKEALMLGWQGSFAASKSEEKLLVISPKDCRKAAVKIIVGDNIMCTEPRTEDVMCNVDSGAPLIVKANENYQVIGISTWNRNDCDSNIPAIFTRVSYFKGWIENHAV